MSFEEKSFQQHPITQAELDNAVADAMRRVYNWMGLGLLVTAVVALLLQIFPEPLYMLLSIPYGFLILFALELGLVIWLGRAIYKLSPGAALAGFLVYAAVNGISMSVIFWIYDLGDIVLAFGTTMLLFFTMSVIGYVTKINLAKMGGFLLMGLVGFVIASVVNLFFYNEFVYWLITYAGIVIFIGLTVYDTQKIKQLSAAALASGDEDNLKRVGVMGALKLYLDFINLFLLILRVVGRRR